VKAYILDESALAGGAADDIGVRLHDDHITIAVTDVSEVKIDRDEVTLRINERRVARRIAYLLCLAADASDADQFLPIVPPPARPLSCGCAPGAHPPSNNLLKGAAERDGRVCELGWPTG
jgi:hypothetical protein